MLTRLRPGARVGSVVLVVMIVLQRAQTSLSFPEVTTAAVSVLLAGSDAQWLTR